MMLKRICRRCPKAAVLGKPFCRTCQLVEDVRLAGKNAPYSTPEYRKQRTEFQKIPNEQKTCWICGKGTIEGDMWTLDHIVPLMFDRNSTETRAAHKSCNSRRGRTMRNEIQ